MPGKKTSSRSKTAKSTLVEQMISAFKATPAKIIAQFRKEIATAKQYESKVKTEFTKIQESLKAAKNKSMILADKLKTKSSPTLRKQLKTAKKMHDQLKKTFSSLTTQLSNAQKQLKALTEKHTKFANLAKNMNQFEKQPAKVKTKPKMQNKKRPTPATQKPSTVTSMSPEEQEISTDEPVEIS